MCVCRPRASNTRSTTDWPADRRSYDLRMSYRIATRGAREGRCNICGEVGKLTEDHTPPKGCYKPKQVELQSILRRLTATTEGPGSRISQNGVKYRTLCARCNNGLLGANYDPCFIDFVNQIAALLNSQLILPPTMFVKGNPQAIMRALLGHLAAQGVDRYLKGPLTEAYRDYFLDTSLPLPEGLEVFYWVYPFQSHVMARDAVYVDFGDQQPVMIWILKFFPVAFMVTWKMGFISPFPLMELSQWRDVPFAEEVELPVRLVPLPPEGWPEAPTDNSTVAYGREAINVTSRE